MPRHRGQTAQPKTRDAEQSTHHIIQCSVTPQREVDNVYIYAIYTVIQAAFVLLRMDHRVNDCTGLCTALAEHTEL